MRNAQLDQQIARRSAQVYLPLSIGAALAFVVASSVVGDYPVVARFGGAFWTGLLTLIVSMPLVISRFKRQLRTQSEWCENASESAGSGNAL